jgi:uncharacterized membrane protein
LYGLAQESLWYDEVLTFRLVGQSLPAMMDILWFKGQEAHPPLYFLLMHFWVKLAGTSEVALRLPSVFFGILGLFMVFKMAALLWDGEAGLWSSMIVALSVFHIRYSQEARMYSLFFLLAVTSFYFLVRMMKGRQKGAVWGYALSTALLLYCHFYGLFIVAGQNVFYLFFRRSHKETVALGLKKWFLLQALLALVFVPYLKPLCLATARIKTGFWIVEPNFRALKKTFIRYADSRFLFYVFIALAVRAFYYSRSRRDGGFFPACGLLGAWLFIPVLLPYFYSRVSTPIFVDRYTIGSAPAFYIWAAMGLASIDRRILKRLVAAAVITASVVCIFVYFKKVVKEQWRETAALVDESIGKGDLLLFNTDSENIVPACVAYYSKNSAQPTQEIITEETLGSFGQGGFRKAVLVLSHCTLDKDAILERLRRLFGPPREHHLRGVDVYICGV